MYLSYSGFSKHEGCSFAYWHEYVNGTQLQELEDRLGSIFGSATGALFDTFYREKIWRAERPQEVLMSKVDSVVEKTLSEATSPRKHKLGGVLKWRGSGSDQNPKGMYADRQELTADVRDAVARGLRIIRHHRLLGPRADSELKLDSVVKGHKLGGRLDFLIHRTRPHNDLVLLDGKGSKYREKYVDPRQLLWYAMLLRIKEKVFPDKVGFVFWRCNPEESLDWVEFDPHTLWDFLSEVLDTISDIERRADRAPKGTHLEVVREVFKPNPDKANCRLCPYAVDSLCPEGAKFAKKPAKR